MPRDSFTPYNGQSLVLPSEGNVICCGFLTHCMLVLIEDFPAQNGGAPINQIVDTLGDDAAIIAITLARWDVPVTLLSNPLGDDYYGRQGIKATEDLWPGSESKCRPRDFYSNRSGSSG